MHTALTQKSIDLYDRYVMKTYPKADILFTRGSGCRLWDGDGREYLDFAAGIAVCSLGHCHPAVTRAIAEQAGTLVHVSNLYMNQRQPELAEKLAAQGIRIARRTVAKYREAIGIPSSSLRRKHV